MAAIEKMTIDSYADGLPLHIIFAEAKEPKGVLQCCHGMTEHKERYIPFLEYMADHGYHCFLHDMRGHGESVRDFPEDLGYFYENGMSSCVKDLLTVNDHIRKRFPDLPLFLFGHSMGSLEVRTYCKTHSDTISGLIVCGCPSPVSATPFGKTLISVLTAIKGERYRSAFVNKMALGAYNKPFAKESPSPNNWISVNRENVEAYDNSPLCGFTFTLNGFATLMDLMLETYSSKGWIVHDPDMPIWFISGEDDPCRGTDAQFRKALSVMTGAGYRDVTYKLYPGLRHELLNEKSAPKVMEDILAKLNSWL